jgi:hypothetical protein
MKTELKQDAIVTKLGKVKGIIGMDFLQNHKCQLKLSEVKLVIGQQSFNLRKHYNTNVVALISSLMLFISTGAYKL